MNSGVVKNIRVFAPQTRNELIDFVLREKPILVAVNAEKILHASPLTREIINRNVGYPDGVGAVWALKKKGLKATKIPGCELWLDIIDRCHKDKTFYLVGGSETVIQNTVSKLKNTYPGIRLLNFRNGYLYSEDEKKELLEDIAAKKPDIVFVAMGSPKQELLMEESYKHHMAVYQGLGGSFDVYTGVVNRAPAWWVRNHLEWAYRLIKQPSRIGRQIHLIRFFFLLQLNRL